jgi:hypothetical protein
MSRVALPSARWAAVLAIAARGRTGDAIARNRRKSRGE